MRTPLVQEIAGQTVLVAPGDAGPYETVDQFTALIGDCLGEGAVVLALPVEAIGEEFFRLRSGLAGEVLQKLVNYRIKLAIVGDVSRQVEASSAFRDLVVEAERGTDLYFVSDMAELGERLGAVFQT